MTTKDDRHDEQPTVVRLPNLLAQVHNRTAQTVGHDVDAGTARLTAWIGRQRQQAELDDSAREPLSAVAPPVDPTSTRPTRRIRKSRSSVIAVATFGSIATSAVISMTWFFTTSGTFEFEQAVQSLGLLAGLTGILAERRASARERRHHTLTALADELRRATSVLDNLQFTQGTETLRPRVYPRLPVSATDAVLTSGALTERSDDDLFRLLHNWRDEVNGFNRRLELTEIRVFTLGTLAEVAEFERALHHSDGYSLNQIRRHLRDLQSATERAGPSRRYSLTFASRAEERRRLNEEWAAVRTARHRCPRCSG
jgi:hypothetical protein